MIALRLPSLVAVLALIPLPAVAALSRPASPPPNVIIILADNLGVYSAKDIRTPNLDRLAAEGMRFADCYAESVCTPARAAPLTGAYQPTP